MSQMESGSPDDSDSESNVGMMPGPGLNAGTLTSLAVVSAIVVALYVARDVFVPIVLAVLLSFVLTPLVRLLRRARVPRVPSVLLAVLVALTLILSLGALIGIEAASTVADIPRYAAVIESKVTKLREATVDRMTNMIAQRLPRVSEQRPSEQPDKAGRPLPVEMHQPEPTPLELAERVLPPVALPLASVGVVFVVAIFILLQQNDIRERMIRLLGLRDLHRTARALDDAASRLARYLLAQLGVNAAFGVIVAVGLTMIGVPNPPLWGTLAALFRFLPYIGSVLCAALPIALAVAVDPGWQMAIYTALLFIVTEIVMGQFVDPLAFGRSTGLSPLSVVIAAIFWTWMWGPIGLPLSTPLTACLVVLGRHVKRLEFLDILLGDRPVLTPIERFCQCVLADNAADALEDAEDLISQQSLVDYYDNVAIEGLRLAAGDLAHDANSTALARRIERAMTVLIRELDGGDTGGDAAAATEERKVLCVASGDILDRIVADILARLLRERRVEAHVVSFGTTLDTLDHVDLREIGLIYVCGLDLSLHPARYRYVTRRVRRVAPDIPIIALLVPRSSPWPEREQSRRHIGVEQVAATLRDALAYQLIPNEPARPIHDAA
jgi:predicted PurR-regulated permease PerM